jgi:hypothetical protein
VTINVFGLAFCFVPGSCLLVCAVGWRFGLGGTTRRCRHASSISLTRFSLTPLQKQYTQTSTFCLTGIRHNVNKHTHDRCHYLDCFNRLGRSHFGSRLLKLIRVDFLFEVHHPPLNFGQMDVSTLGVWRVACLFLGSQITTLVFNICFCLGTVFLRKVVQFVIPARKTTLAFKYGSSLTSRYDYSKQSLAGDRHGNNQ